MIWSALAKLLAIPSVANWLIRRAQRTPYTHIYDPDGSLYMERWWLFNPYPGSEQSKRWDWLPSIRIHRIHRPDQDRHFHNHPWSARTFILAGWYDEERLGGSGRITRTAGESARIDHDDFHKIVDMSHGGVYTLFVTGRYRHTWGFLVPWREYDKTKGQQ